jgi:hypothetical protein
MDRKQVVTKLEQIEEQAELTLNEFPKHLTRERLRLIIALARFMRVELSGQSGLAAGQGTVAANEESAAAGW